MAFFFGSRQPKKARASLKRLAEIEKNTFLLTELLTLVKSVTSYLGAG